MRSLRETTWGPPPLPEYLTDQLDAHGFGPGDAGRCARLITERPGSTATASLFVDLGACKFMEGDVDGAIAAWRHAMSSGHDAPAARALLDLGLLYEHVHLHEVALGVLRSAVERNIDPYVIPAVMASARCQRALGHHEQSVETMARLAQRIMSLDPERPELVETLYGLGDVALESGRTDRAERAWRVAARGTKSDFSRAAAGRLVALLADHAQVAELLDVLDNPAVELDDVGSESALGQAALLSERGDRAASLRIADHVDATTLGVVDRFRLAELRVRGGEVNQGIDLLESLLGHDTAAVMNRAALRLGEIYRDHDMQDAAITMLERVVDDDDPYWTPRAGLLLGDLYHDAGDADAAHTHWSAVALSSDAALRAEAQDRVSRAMVAVTEPESRPEPVAESADADVPGQPAPRPAGPPATPRSAEPQVVSLASDRPDPAPDVSGIQRTNGHVEVIALDDLEDEEPHPGPASGLPNASTFAERSKPAHLQNPYASLAPDREPIRPPANPYAELAPKRIERPPPPDVETGDWESILDDWPEDDAEEAPSAFSRHTR